MKKITTPISEEMIKQGIIAESQKELARLNPDSLIGWNKNGEIPKSHETIRFGDLPLKEQESIRKGLESSARGDVERWEFQ